VVDYNAEMIAAGPRAGRDAGDHLAGRRRAAACRCRTPAADAYVISFGIRNVTDIPGALAEGAPGAEAGRAVPVPGVLAAGDRGAAAGLRRLFLQGDPEIGARVANDRRATSTWWRASAGSRTSAVRRHDRRGGFSQVGWTNFTGGVAALHTGGRSSPHGLVGAFCG
jgi:demethylmenaquinone methyltransferase/2-methoxy-6-polyprenyl-1,4-benzoquinol methylase